MDALKQEEIRILIAHPDPQIFAEVDEAQVDERLVRIVARASEASQTIEAVYASKPDVLIIDGDCPALTPMETLEKIFVEDLPVGSVILWERQDNANIRAAMRVGAEDFLIKPVDAETLLTAVNSVFNIVREKYPDGWKSLAAAKTGNAVQSAPAMRGKVIGICSGKAAVGKTTLATNLAMALAKFHGRKTTLVDLDRNDAAVLLNLHPARGIADLTKTEEELDFDMISSCCVHHREGLALLTGSVDPSADALEIIPQATLERVVNLLSQNHDFVVLLLPMLHGDRQLAYLELCDEVYLVATDHNLLDLKGAKTFLDMITQKHVALDKTHVILNQHSKSAFVSPQEVEKTFGRKIHWVLPEDQKLATDSINLGVPFVLKDPRKPLSEAIIHLAAFIAGEADAPSPESDERHGWWHSEKKH